MLTFVGQRGNPVIPFIKGVRWEYGDILPDYQVGAHTCVLYLSSVSPPPPPQRRCALKPSFSFLQTEVSPIASRVSPWED